MQAIQQACFLWFCSHLLSSSCTCLYERSDYHGEVSQHKADGLQLSFIPLRDIWKWIQIVTYSRVIRVPRIDWFVSCVCLRKGSRKKKGSSRHQLHHVSVTVPGHRGQWDKSSCCPQNRARASIRTGRRLCGNRQRSLWSAELFLLCHRTSRSGRPFIHPIACQQVRGHTQRHTRIKKNTPYMLYQWTISRSATCCIWWNLLWRCLSYHFCFFCHPGIFVSFPSYMSVFIRELPVGVWAEGRWKHTWFPVTSCLRHSVSLSVSASLAGSATHLGHAIGSH